MTCLEIFVSRKRKPSSTEWSRSCFNKTFNLHQVEISQVRLPINQDAIQLIEALNEPDSIVLKEEEEENKYYAIKFEEFLNHPIKLTWIYSARTDEWREVSSSTKLKVSKFTKKPRPLKLRLAAGAILMKILLILAWSKSLPKIWARKHRRKWENPRKYSHMDQKAEKLQFQR